VPSSGADLCDERRQSARSGALALSGAPDSTVVELKGYPVVLTQMKARRKDWMTCLLPVIVALRSL
ncbi:MAG: hypothetical protein WA134_08510, partial [Rhodoferax sp.]|uniref:hypothetical protein n=1 Tax=Rhodoferax sp. TaxID=50421 RepID=UPI003BB69AF0